MNFIQDKVSNMVLQDIVQLITDYELFERQGAIGDCLLRKTANELVDQFGLSSGHIVLWMDKVAFEAYRHIANTFLTEAGLK